MSSENKTCYETAKQNSFIRFEAGGLGNFLLPYSRLLFVKLTPGDWNAVEDALLHMIYPNYDVVIAGSNLLPLVKAIQQKQVKTICIGGKLSKGTTNAVIKQIDILQKEEKELKHPVATKNS